MAVIHEYIVELASWLCTSNRPVLLDYGCGTGELVLMALNSNMEAYGVELFYEGGNTRETVAGAGLLGSRVFELSEGVIPFPDETFDLVISNQVFEHIDDFSTPLAEISRVLKPHGLFINLFPTSDVWREGHVGIPFVHRFKRGSRLRWIYTFLLRSLGCGYHKDRGKGRIWTNLYLKWLDDWTYYKPWPLVHSLFGKYFVVESCESDYMRYRISRHPRLRSLAPLVKYRIFDAVLSYLCKRLSGRVFVLGKKMNINQ